MKIKTVTITGYVQFPVKVVVEYANNAPDNSRDLEVALQVAKRGLYNKDLEYLGGKMPAPIWEEATITNEEEA